MAILTEIVPDQMQRMSAGRVAPRSPFNESSRKDTFVATLAHELRQPLSALGVAIDVVRVTPDLEVARRAAHVMRRQVNQMSRLVEDLVESTRWAFGKMTLHTCRLDLRSVISDTAGDARNGVEEHGLTLVVDAVASPVWVDGDAQRLQQVIANLVRNAVQHTESGGHISITVEETDSTVTLCVRDTGRGIHVDALPYVFELFSQVRPQDSVGLGIGLNIASEIVLLHGGRIEARSAGEGKGSEFLVTLPLEHIVA